MKVIDLINDIRNKKEVPKKIKIKKYVFELDEYAYEKNDSFEKVYIDGCKFWLRNFCSYDFWLSDEVEIIEENKEIKKLGEKYITFNGNYKEFKNLDEYGGKILANKIDEIIDVVNKLKKEGKGC